MYLKRMKHAGAAGTGRCKCVFAGTLLLVALFAGRASAQDATAIDRIKWVVGPAKVHLGVVAQIDLPAGYRFTDAAGARLWAEVNGNPPIDGDVGVIIPPAEAFVANQGWSITLAYDDCGHVRDDEKLDADTAAAILNAITENTDKANQQRAARGWNTVKVLGWQQSPFYDPQSHRLTWSLSLSNDGSTTPTDINYTSRLLGRTGVISANLVVSPDNLPTALPTYQSLTGGVSFDPGNGYREFRSGDKVAKYGLVGLITSGVAVAAVKAWPLLLKVGAVIVGVILAALAKLKSIFTGKRPWPAAGSGKAADSSSASESAAHPVAGSPFIVRCPVCKQSNRIAASTSDAPARCGRCKAELRPA